MSFELENPEIAGLVAQYKDGCIAYGDAKNHIVLEFAKPFQKADYKGDIYWDISDEQYKELEKQAKELLLGKESESN